MDTNRQNSWDRLKMLLNLKSAHVHWSIWVGIVGSCFFAMYFTPYLFNDYLTLQKQAKHLPSVTMQPLENESTNKLLNIKLQQIVKIINSLPSTAAGGIKKDGWSLDGYQTFSGDKLNPDGTHSVSYINYLEQKLYTVTTDLQELKLQEFVREVQPSAGIVIERDSEKSLNIKEGFLEQNAIFAMLVSGICLAVAILVLLIAFPVFIFSNNQKRSDRAGALVKTSFRFFVASGVGVIGSLSFV